MSLNNIGGSLSPQTHDGSTVDAVYGVAADGSYLGVVPAAQASSVASRPPPTHGQWRWDGAAWAQFKPRERRALEVEMARDKRIADGVTWNGIVWYADAACQQQIAAFLQAYAEGLITPGALTPIRAKDKSVQMLSRADLRALAGAILAYVQGVWDWSWTQKAALKD